MADHSMTPERAREILAAINNRALITMGIDQPLLSIEGVTLSEMLEAKAMVVAQNERAQADAQQNGGGYRIAVVPDDRLIAAAYALQHFAISRDPILCLPIRDLRGSHAAIAVVAVTPTEDDTADEEDGL
ncbi:hypothetical protein V5F41_12545 [Xanthobacter autotrophicus]|uniref:hypothetical protein n=1 Tax=Xanthobacter autotrophicus TaxID=280 RepID=UPI00372CCD99